MHLLCIRSRSQRNQSASEEAMPLALYECTFILQNGERLLQASDLLLPSTASLHVRLRLGAAAPLQCPVEVEHSRQLCAGALTIGAMLHHTGVQGFGLLHLV